MEKNQSVFATEEEELLPLPDTEYEPKLVDYPTPSSEGNVDYQAHDSEDTVSYLNIDAASLERHGFKFKETEYGLVLVSYTGSAVNVIVPAFVEDLPVVYIAEEAFDTTTLNVLALPATLSTIDLDLFSNAQVNTLVLPDYIRIKGCESEVDSYKSFMKLKDNVNNIRSIKFGEVQSLAYFNDINWNEYTGNSNLMTLKELPEVLTRQLILIFDAISQKLADGKSILEDDRDELDSLSNSSTLDSGYSLGWVSSSTNMLDLGVFRKYLKEPLDYEALLNKYALESLKMEDYSYHTLREVGYTLSYLFTGVRLSNSSFDHLDFKNNLLVTPQAVENKMVTELSLGINIRQSSSYPYMVIIPEGCVKADIAISSNSPVTLQLPASLVDLNIVTETKDKIKIVCSSLTEAHRVANINGYSVEAQTSPSIIGIIFNKVITDKRRVDVADNLNKCLIEFVQDGFMYRVDFR